MGDWEKGRREEVEKGRSRGGEGGRGGEWGGGDYVRRGSERGFYEDIFVVHHPNPQHFFNSSVQVYIGQSLTPINEAFAHFNRNGKTS